MDANKKLTKTIVIRITDEQYRKLLDSVKLLPKNTDELNNRSQIIREAIDKYLVPKCRS
jgi:predicted DNA-binding protein